MSRYKTKAAQARQRARVWDEHAVRCDECGTMCEATGTVDTDQGTERVGLCAPCQAAEADNDGELVDGGHPEPALGERDGADPASGALPELGQRWLAFCHTPTPSGATWASVRTNPRPLPCAACYVAGVDPVRYSDPRTAAVVPWDVMGDPRAWAFVCDECAGEDDGGAA